MKLLLTLAFAVMALIPASFAMENKTQPDMAVPALKAVVFYADNCGACKVLEPKMMDAMAVVNKDKIDVVTFDFSNKQKIEKTKALAKDKNINGILQKFGAKTGFVTLVDTKGEIVDMIGKDDTAADMATKLVKAMVTAL